MSFISYSVFGYMCFPKKSELRFFVALRSFSKVCVLHSSQVKHKLSPKAFQILFFFWKDFVHPDPFHEY